MFKLKIVKILIVFKIFSSVPEVPKKNSKACFCISVAGRLLGTAKNYHKKYRKKINFFTIPQVNKFKGMSFVYSNRFPHLSVSVRIGCC